MSITPTTEGALFICADCGRGFSRIQGLGRHMKETHGKELDTPTARKKSGTPPPTVAPTFVSELAADIDRQMRELAATYKPRLSELDAKISEAQQVVVALKVEKKEIESTIRRLDPSSYTKPGRKPQGAGSKQGEAALLAVASREKHKLDNTRTWLGEHVEDYADGVSVNALTAAMKAANLQPASSAGKVAIQIEALRDEGFVRAIGLGQGGGMLYKVVSNGASADGA